MLVQGRLRQGARARRARARTRARAALGAAAGEENGGAGGAVLKVVFAQKAAVVSFRSPAAGACAKRFVSARDLPAVTRIKYLGGEEENPALAWRVKYLGTADGEDRPQSARAGRGRPTRRTARPRAENRPAKAPAAAAGDEGDGEGGSTSAQDRQLRASSARAWSR